MHGNFREKPANNGKKEVLECQPSQQLNTPILYNNRSWLDINNIAYRIPSLPL